MYLSRKRCLKRRENSACEKKYAKYSTHSVLHSSVIEQKKHKMEVRKTIVRLIKHKEYFIFYEFVTRFSRLKRLLPR